MQKQVTKAAERHTALLCLTRGYIKQQTERQREGY